MGQFIDLTGKIYGRLTVIERVKMQNKKEAYWRCACACGEEIITRGSSLRNAHTTSCGCLQRDVVSEKLAKPFEIGEKIGYWVILGRASGYNGKGAYWHCRCICGAERDINGEHLRNGATTSCGCMQGQSVSEANLINLIGQRFGTLTVVQKSDKKVKGDVYWQCVCDCGNIIDTSGHNLRRGSTLSCGCLGMSHGEYHISDLLNNNHIDYIYNRGYFADLKNEDNNLLRYDFILFDNNHRPYRIIEFDGIQHNEPINFFGGFHSLLKTKKNDIIKNQYALSHNIPLVRIPYSKRDSMTLDDLLGNKYLIKGEI